MLKTIYNFVVVDNKKVLFSQYLCGDYFFRYNFDRWTGIALSTKEYGNGILLFIVKRFLDKVRSLRVDTVSGIM